MKHTNPLLLVLAMALGAVACGGGDEVEETTTATDDTGSLSVDFLPRG